LGLKSKLFAIIEEHPYFQLSENTDEVYRTTEMAWEMCLKKAKEQKFNVQKSKNKDSVNKLVFENNVGNNNKGLLEKDKQHREREITSSWNNWIVRKSKSSQILTFDEFQLYGIYPLLVEMYKGANVIKLKE